MLGINIYHGNIYTCVEISMIIFLQLNTTKIVYGNQHIKFTCYIIIKN